ENAREQSLKNPEEHQAAAANNPSRPPPAAAQSQPQARAAPAQPRPPQNAPRSEKPVAPQPTDGASNQGVQADKQSQPTSGAEVPRDHWQMGRPLANKGLELRPRRPTFTLLTMLTSAPGNPLCEMLFNKDGVVTNARIVDSSGDPRIDEGILNSLYYWRAAGE